ncbi:hypothetical protein [Actinocorallia populi]|uniref:hypothetical protein n=1 Tax=Actinocorallia populi TaxID=2079200 RepID=UPI000D08CD4F|nr:hypothetical protein [Actinocorallia populi]
MESTTAFSRPTRLPWRADLLTALLGLALEAVAAFFVVIASGLASGADSHRSGGGTGRADQILVLGLGALACLALLVALLLRAKAPITTALHLLLSAALLLAVLTAPPVSRPPARTPVPSSTGSR